MTIFRRVDTARQQCLANHGDGDTLTVGYFKFCKYVPVKSRAAVMKKQLTLKARSSDWPR